MIVPTEVIDDFGQPAVPSTTLLTYKLRLSYEKSLTAFVQSEELSHSLASRTSRSSPRLSRPQPFGNP